MIVSGLIEALTTLVGGMFALLPTSTIGVLDPATYSSTWSVIGGYMGRFDHIFHTVWILRTTGTVLGVMLPGVLTYKLANWVYKHLPTFAGFGTGSG